MSRLEGNDLHVAGRLTAGSFTPPAGSIGSTAINTGDPLPSAGLVHRHRIRVELFGPTTTITALTKWLGAVLAAGTIKSVKGYIAVQATGADRTVTIDLQKSTAGGAFATVLSVTVNITNGTVIRTAVSGTISAAAVVAGDILQGVVTVAGSASAQAQGLLLEVEVDENPT